jgi:hypothetical protein
MVRRQAAAWHRLALAGSEAVAGQQGVGLLECSRRLGWALTGTPLEVQPGLHLGDAGRRRRSLKIGRSGVGPTRCCWSRAGWLRHPRRMRPRSAPKPSRPGPGRPPGIPNQHRALRPDVGKTVTHTPAVTVEQPIKGYNKLRRSTRRPRAAVPLRSTPRQYRQLLQPEWSCLLRFGIANSHRTVVGRIGALDG